MDSIHILEYDRWKKFNDVIGKNQINFSSLNKNIVSTAKSLTNEDGFIKQHIIGAGVNSGKPRDKSTIMVFTAE